MSKYGLKIARLFGETLPNFPTRREAERNLTAFRDDRLGVVKRLASSSDSFVADYSPDSLKALEMWYFDLFESCSFSKINTSREEFEEGMAMYFGEVFVRNVPDAVWVVEEYVFQKDKFEIGVRNGLLTIMLRRKTDHFKRRDNKRKQSIYREFRKYAS